jgi:diguanylate cyclase (GGDEF)-like protein/PAS domain S-box-containing protein
LNTFLPPDPHAAPGLRLLSSREEAGALGDASSGVESGSADASTLPLLPLADGADAGALQDARPGAWALPAAPLWRAVLVAVAVALYLAVGWVLAPTLGAFLLAAALLPVALVGWVGGTWAGALAGLALVPLQAWLCVQSGAVPGDARLVKATAGGALAMAAAGAVIGHFRQLRDGYRAQVRALVEAELRLRESEERYALASRGANDGLWDWDLRSDRVYVSARGRSILGFPEEDGSVSSEEWYERCHPEDKARIRQEIDSHLTGETPQYWAEYRVRHRDGGYVWVLARGLAVRDAHGVAYRLAGSLTDVSDQKRSEERLWHQALHDSLTGLPNRHLFLDRLRQVLAGAREGGPLFAVLFLDLDRFKLVNDSLGHLVGDELLRAVARVMREQLREGDMVARLGGDEFAVLLESLESPEQAMAAAERLERSLRAPFRLAGQELFTSVSVGLVLGTDAAARPEDLLRDADSAMYRAKGLGRACVQLFTPQLHASALESLTLDADMRRGLERDEFVVHYQPIIDLVSGRITGVEALVRWQHPERGLVPPSAFIPVAEETGLIVPLGERVLEKACRQVQAWDALRGEGRGDERGPLQLCVNLSARQLAQGGAVEMITRTLEATGLEPSRLKLEVTESVVIRDIERTSEMLSRLRSLGVSLSMDDFGTGYSSLSMLHQFPLQTLKVDRSFVGRMNQGERSREIVRTILGLAGNLGLDAVAEGVETPEQLAELRRMGCRYGQGFLFARPLDAARIAQLLGEDPCW